MARTRLYRDGKLVAENFPPAEISDHLEADDGSLIWLDLDPEDGDQLDVIVEEFQLHELAVEDALEDHERPKLDVYASHLFLTATGTRLDPATGELVLCKVSTFITDRALITVPTTADFPIDEMLRRWDSGGLPVTSVGAMVHGLVDIVVDSHFTTVEALDDELEKLEDLLFADRPSTTKVQRRSFEVRKSLVHLRKLAMPMREVVNTLLRRDIRIGEVPLVDQAATPYFHDVYDHVLRVTEWTDSMRDVVGTVLETNLTIQGNRMNSIMKKVTSWAAVIAVPTAVTGFYGQNVPYPGYGHWSGFVLSTVIIVALSLGLVALFKKNDWL
ncbi:magnesium transporter CorA family protein [Spongisporangium articulatum]|uniref:Magnesium transporter CorA family protein n=1 Tax=Spongisporangium articulatum TaxID=3362603 RepID=A0ABW8AMH0_9ACTN